MSAPAIIDRGHYGELLAKTLPAVVRTEEQNAAYVAQLEEFTSRNDLTAEEEELAKLLIMLVEKFETEHYQLTAAGPVDVLIHLMNSNGLKQKDLEDVFGTASIVSEVLRGKRSVNLKHIKKLSARFNISPEVFF